ncbi:MAG: transglutaminase TgpA family protein [Acidiferrobacter sp.]
MARAAALPIPSAVGGLMAGALLPLLGRLPWWTMAIVGALLAWRLRGRGHWPLPPRALTWLLGLLAAALIFARFGTVIGERPGLSFFVLLFGLKLLETREHRDLVILVLLSYVALLGGLLLWPSLAMGGYALVFVVLSFVALSVLAQPGGLSWAARMRLVVVLLLKALPLALLLYLLFPRLNGGLWNRRIEAVGLTGVSPVLRPGAISRLVPSRKVALRVLFTGPPPPPTARYFRVYCLTVTNGHSWRRGRPEPLGHTGGGAGPTYTVLLNPSGRRALPALDWPVRAPRGARLVSGAVLRARRPVRHLRRYRLDSGPVRLTSLPAAERARDLQLPPRLDPRVRALAQRWSAHDAPAPTIIARALAYFVRHHFVYTLTPPWMGRHPVRRFLFTVRAGYCADYATAFATLMRAAGVPTRVIVGYLGGQYNPDGGDVVLRARDAHAWDESWVEGRWQRIDPTAVVAPASVRYGIGFYRRLLAHGGLAHDPNLLRPSWLAQVRRGALRWHDAAITAWDNWVMSYDWRRQAQLLRRLGWRDAGRAALALALLAVMVLAAYAIRALGARVPVPTDPALAAWRRAGQRLAAVGLPAAPHEGPLTYARRVRRARPDLAADITHLTTLYIAVRYGDGADQLPLLRRAVRRFRPPPPSV